MKSVHFVHSRHGWRTYVSFGGAGRHFSSPIDLDLDLGHSTSRRNLVLYCTFRSTSWDFWLLPAYDPEEFNSKFLLRRTVYSATGDVVVPNTYYSTIVPGTIEDSECSGLTNSDNPVSTYDLYFVQVVGTVLLIGNGWTPEILPIICSGASVRRWSSTCHVQHATMYVTGNPG